MVANSDSCVLIACGCIASYTRCVLYYPTITVLCSLVTGAHTPITPSTPSTPAIPALPTFKMPPFLKNPPSLSNYSYADLERHYWQCLILLENHKRYTEAVRQCLKEAYHHQQIMLLQTDKYQEYLQKLLPPVWEPEVPFSFLKPPSTKTLSKLEFEGTFDRPVVNKVV